jgi:uncharacterized damage-inducible protein DinB
MSTVSSTSASSSRTAVQEVLVDAFGRIREEFADLCDGLSQADAARRPTADANSIAWMLWHLTRIQDDHVCGITGDEQVWTSDGWYDRFGMPFGPREHGYGHNSEQVAAVQVEPALLDGYHAAVHALTIAYVSTVDDTELARVVDEAWDPPVTASVRLVSVIGDCMQHLGQAAYVRGMLGG